MNLLNTRLNRRSLVTTLGIAGLTTLTFPIHAAAQRSPFTPATPSAETTSTTGSLADVLAMVPLSVLDGATGGMPWTWNDLAGQFAALNMHHDLAGPDESEPFVNATLALVGSSPLLAWALDEELIAAIGFQPLGVNQILYAGEPGNQVQLFVAPFEADALFAAWAASGYAQVDTVGDVIAWSIGPESEFDIEHPIQRRVINSMNNLALVGDVIVATPTLDSLVTVLEFGEVGGESLLDEPATGPIVATLPDTIAAAMALQPEAILSPPFDVSGESSQEAELEAIRADLGPMPSVLGAIVAVDAGAYMIESDWSESGTREETIRADAGTAHLHFATATPADAEQALAVVERRWDELHSVQSHLAYSEIMDIEQGTVTGSIVELFMRQLLQPSFWQQLILSRDILPLVPDEA